MSDDSAATVLLVLRVKPFASAEAVAELVDVPVVDLDAQLQQMAAVGWVEHRSGIATGWTLTAAGRRHGAQLLRDEVGRTGAKATVERCYREFLPLNRELLAVCTAWQTVEVDGTHIVNDHSDPAHDAEVLSRLAELHAAAVPLLERLAASAQRFSSYAPRLTLAHEMVRSGRTEWIARPILDSYHSVWFELHEHLLVTLGLERSSEPNTPTGRKSNGDPS